MAFDTGHASLDGWSGTATHEVATEDFNTIALGKRRFDELL